jgi:hypothetical protein
MVLDGSAFYFILMQAWLGEVVVKGDYLRVSLGNKFGFPRFVRGWMAQDG